MSDQSRNRVGRAPGWAADHDTYRSRRIGLPPSDARHDRQRRSARGEMQKISAGKFHFEPPFTSFDHLGGTQQYGRWHFEAERPGGLEVDYELEFGGALDR